VSALVRSRLKVLAGIMATRVLRELGDGWLECEDAQGIYYHNTVTKESADTLPPSLAPASNNKVLRELPGGWLECEDAQGVYYFNSATKECSVTPPASIMSQQPTMGAQDQPRVLRELAGTWLECEDANGIFYFNQVTKQSSETIPAGALDLPGLAPAPAPAPVPAPAPANGGGIKVLQQLGGNWVKCMDDQGIFYFNVATKQTSNDLPAELKTPMQAPPPQAVAPKASPQILQELPNNWQKCRDEQGIFYFNKVTQEFSESLPPELSTANQLAATNYPTGATNYPSGKILQQAMLGQQQQTTNAFAGMYQQQPQVASYQQASKPQSIAYQSSLPQAQPQQLQKMAPQLGQNLTNYAVPSVNYAAPAAAVNGGGSRKKLAFGDWVVYEDQMGDFFVHTPTGRQFDKPPEEMVRSYQAYNSAGLITG
jgi:hypothetical protein